MADKQQKHFMRQKMIYQGKFMQAFWTIGSVGSVFLNLLLLVIIVILWAQLNTYRNLALELNNLLNTTLERVFYDFVLMNDAVIDTTVFVEDTIPVQFDLSVKTDTTVTLTEDVPIYGATVVSLSTGGLNIVNAPIDIILPQGTELPISMDIVVPVDETVPVSLSVPVNIPMNQTDLGVPFVDFQNLIWDYLSPETRQSLCTIDRGFNCP